MQLVSIGLRLNRMSNVPIDAILDFKLMSSISEGLPYGYVDLADRNGTFLAEFEHLQIGAVLEISLLDGSGNVDLDDPFKWPEFYVLCLEAGCNFNPAKLAGSIRIWFGHSWFIYKDTRNRVFPPTNHGELIKRVLREDERGIHYDIEDDNFDTTDDSGEINRFKVKETDWNFIRNKVLPYTTIEQLPAHFFANEFGEFFLKSYQSMYKENPTFMIVPNEAALNEDGNMGKVNTVANELNIDKATHIFYESEVDLKIGGPQILDELFPYFMFENLEDGSVITGNKKLGNQLRRRSGSSFANILPVDNFMISQLNGSSVKTICNRQMLDSLSLLFQSSKQVDEMFVLAIEVNFCGHVTSVGQTCHLVVPDYQIAGERKEHWANGKWLNIGFEHYMSKDRSGTKMQSLAYLVRPAFVGRDNSTTLSILAMRQGLYEVP